MNEKPKDGAVATPKNVTRGRPKRDPDLTRVSVLLKNKVIETADGLSKYWSFKDRSQAVDVALRYLAQQTRLGLNRIDVTGD